MSKFLRPKELLATGIQLIVFALLIPFVCVLLYALAKASPEAMQTFVEEVLGEFADSVLSIFPNSDTIQSLISSYGLATSEQPFLSYTSTIMTIISESVISFMYLGMWLNAFKLIFKELFEVIHGLPILQVFCGLIMGALTFPMLEETGTAIMATAFLVVLNVVLIILVYKSVWKKILEILLGLGMQSISAVLSVGYFTAVLSCFTNTYSSPEAAVSAVVLTTCCVMLWLLIPYFVYGK